MSSLQPSPFVKTPTGKQCIYYYTDWSIYARAYLPSNLPIDNISDLCFAFFNVNATQGAFSGDTWADFQKALDGGSTGIFGAFTSMKKAGKQFNLQLGLGGWTWSKYWSDAVATTQSRQTLVNSLTSLFSQYPGLFNGITIDWEYLSNDGVNYGNAGNSSSKNDTDNFILFLQALRAAVGPAWKISMCVTAAPEKIKMPVDRIHPLVDQIHVMTYDFHDGSWGGETKACHHTNLRKSSYGIYSVEEAIAAWLGYGVPSTKLFIGAALYSRGFANTDGLGKSASGGSPDKSWENGVVDYKALPLTGATEHWDDEAKATYSYDPTRRVLNSYDSVDSIKYKCQFVHDNNLGGIIVWEASGDRPYSDSRSLMKVMHDCLTNGTNTGVAAGPKVIPTPPGGTFTPATGGGVTPAPPAPSPPSPAPPAPAPAVTTYNCDYCQVCKKTSNVPCKPKTTPSPAPAPSPTPQPAPSPTPAPAPSPASPPEWQLKVTYKAGQLVTYNGKVYQCRMTHTSQPNWAPSMAIALWSVVPS